MARSNEAAESRTDAAKPTPVLAFIFAFVCFFPYPALSLGASTGLQANHLIAILAVPVILLRRPPRRHLLGIIVFVASLLITAFASLLLGNIAVPGIMVKAMIALVIAAVVLIPAGYLARTEHIVPLTLGAAVAILIHAGVGFYQEMSYARSTFPFLGFYQNPSFLPLSDVAEDYALWIKRPFGLFPEPSAMTSSIGPWLVLFAGILLHHQWRSAMRPTAKILLFVALVCGATLVLRARSGYAPLWVASLLPVLFFSPIARRRIRKTRSPRVLFVLVGGMAVAIVAVVFAGERIGGGEVEENASWQARQQSIVIALTAPSQDVSRFIFGFGPGQSATYLLSTSTAELLPEWYESSSIEPVVTVWSVLGTLYMEMGLFGLGLIVALVTGIARAVSRSSARLLGCCVFAAWLAGVTVTTSYFPLSPIWLCLGVLLAWDRVFVAIPAAAPVVIRRREAISAPRFRRAASGGVG